MKHLRKFEDADYMDMLASQKKNREDFEKSEEERIEQLRKQNRKILKDGNPRISDVEIERKEIIQKVVDGLLADLSNNPGYQSFKEELLSFLDEFPKE
jgi:hypothetical protein